MPCFCNILRAAKPYHARYAKPTRGTMYDICIPTVPISARWPCIGGMMAPPNIIMMSREEPWLVFLPSPAIDKLKIHGHITLQNRPPLMNENRATLPVVDKPISINIIAETPKNNSVRDGFSWPRNLIMMNRTIQIV